jgi:regulator of sirC expression with transglutaminase-like and TPR domain
MEVEGVGLPGHFIVRQIVNEDSRLLIDVFDRGTLVSESDAKHLVRDYAGRELSDQDMRAQSVDEILARVLNNLLGIAGRDSDQEAIRRYCEAMVAIQPNSAEARLMRSQARALTERHAGAIADLDWLIEREPPGFDVLQAEQLRDSLSRQQTSE